MAFALNGEGALWDAVSDGDVAQVKRLLNSKADPNMTCPDSFVRTEMAPKATGTGKSLVCVHGVFVFLCGWLEAIVCVCVCVCVYARTRACFFCVSCVCV